MALGTPVSRGSDRRFVVTTTLATASFTSAVDELMFCHVCINANSVIPDSISGHDGSTSWAQIGSTEVISGNSYSVWGSHSSGQTGTISVARSVSSLMTMMCTSVTGADVSGTVANSLVQSDSGNGYVSSQSLTLSGASGLTMGWWGANGGTIVTPEGTELLNLTGRYNHCYLSDDYDAAGDASPSASNAIAQNSGYFAAEIKEAGAGAGIYREPKSNYIRNLITR